MTSPLHQLPDDPDAWRAWTDEQLRPLGLTVSLLHSVLEAGQRGFVEASPLAPPTGPGSDRWQEMVISFRELTGWEAEDEDGLARTVHPSGRFCVIVRTGLNCVGQFTGGTPTPKNGLGPMLSAIIDHSPEQIPLFTVDMQPKDAEADPREHWLFLSTYFRGSIYSELSLPSARSENKVRKYSKRIQIPPLKFDEESYRSKAPSPLGDGDDDQAPPAAVVDVKPL